MMGETANIQANCVPYAHIIILRDNAPYYDKKGNVKKIENLTESHLKKYLKLTTDSINPHNPCAICIFGIDITENKTNPTIKHVDLGNKFTNKNHGTLFNQKTSLTTLQSAMLDAKTQWEL